MNQLEGSVPSSSIQDTSSPGNSVPVTMQSAIHHYLSATSCYELMQASSKGLVFETTIPFQLSFFALIEHDTDVAPLWDPELRSFVGLMTAQDYINAIRICKNKGINPMEITTKTISDILISAPVFFKNNGFQPIDAEDSLLQLALHFLRTKYDYVPVIDPENGNLISILGPLDILHFFHYIAKLNESLFQVPIENIVNLGTYQNIIVANKNTSINELLELMDYYDLSAIPIVDVPLDTPPATTAPISFANTDSSNPITSPNGNSGYLYQSRLIGCYHKSDVSFIMRAQDSSQIINNLKNYRVEESLYLKDQLLQSGEIVTNFQALITYKRQDTLTNVFNLMVINRTHRAIIIDDNGFVRGVISFRDILKFFLNGIMNR